MTDAREKYRQGYDRISWANSKRPEYQGGVRPIVAPPIGCVIIEAESDKPKRDIIPVAS